MGCRAVLRAAEGVVARFLSVWFFVQFYGQFFRDDQSRSEQ
jgi:hypothetical protein